MNVSGKAEVLTDTEKIRPCNWLVNILMLKWNSLLLV